MKYFFFSLLLSLLLPNVGLACASCGSGADDPLILYPSDSWRMYLGVSRSTGFKTISANGELGKENGPQFKDSAVIAIGKSINPDAFVTLTFPYLQNIRSGDVERSLGDPMIASRWTLIQQDITEEWVPQLQFMLSHRFAYARAIQEAEHNYLLDVFGTGIPETKVGLDVFHGMKDIKAGFAFALLFPGERRLGDVTVSPGVGARSIASAGYGRKALGKVMSGLVIETRNKTRIDGHRIDGSESRNNAIFLTLDAELTPLDMIRVTISRRAALFENRQTGRADSVTFAYLRSL